MTLVQRVLQAKTDNNAADSLIKDYIPFIKSEVSKFMGTGCSEQDDEYSIGLIAFHEAITGYEESKGAFINYAAKVIYSRLVDNARKENRHIYVSIDEEGEDERPLYETIKDEDNTAREKEDLAAAKQEVLHLAKTLEKYGLDLFSISENSPKQDRTLAACTRTVRYATENKEILAEIERTGKLPLAALSQGAGVEKKTLERHRKYLLAMMIIQTNGFEIIRHHIKGVLKGG